ncbi:MAG: hypothetical protein NZM37_02340, partial [Sandaracinaceae bacterium]|nr:hypothetical protein [Sandaracinaceae bacterium]
MRQTLKSIGWAYCLAFLGCGGGGGGAGVDARPPGIDVNIRRDAPSIMCVSGEENTVEACTDGCDNDGDRYVDCQDRDCCGVVSCGPTTYCGMRDAGMRDDANCPSEVGEESTVEACTDGCDNDGDRYVD